MAQPIQVEGLPVETSELLVDRGVRLFRFLARAQQLRTAEIPTTDRYERDGAVHWLGSLPEHPAVQVGGQTFESAEGDALILSVARLPKSQSPELPEHLLGWVDVEPNSLKEPQLRREQATVAGDGAQQESTIVNERPDVLTAFDRWMTLWRAWAAKESVERPVRDLYEKLFRTHMTAVQRGEEMELIVGAGLLTWHAEAHQPVSRHVFTVPAVGAIHDQTGTLSFSVDTSAIGANVELDMLDPALVPESSVVTTLNTDGAVFAGSILREEDIAPLGKSLVNKLAAAGRYDSATERPTPTPDPVVTWAPALILRVRSNTGLVAAFDKIADEIAETQSVPEGLLPLLDPDRMPPSLPDPSPGALLDVDGEVFSPLPLNQKQRDIIDRVDHHAQTIVQGPPGTGKTHTAAALLSHLLAQGKRVLVTAHTDRALGEVRNKLPAKVRPLAVSVIGSSRTDMADLKVAVETIGRRSVEHDHAEAEREVSQRLEDVERLRLRRMSLAEQLVSVRERETLVMTHGRYRGTLAQIAQQCHAEVPEFSWLAPLADLEPDSDAPLTNAAAARWLELLLDPILATDAGEAQLRRVNREHLLRPDEFGRLVAARNAASAEAATHVPALEHPTVPALRGATTEQRAQLVQALRGILTGLRATQLFPGEWVPAAMADVRGGFSTSWFDRARAITALVEQATPGIQALGVGTTIEVDGDHGQLRALATSLSQHLKAGGTVRTTPDGTPKIGMFTSSPVKAAKPLFEQVKVGGLPPTTREQLDQLLRWIENEHLLHDLDRSWPQGVHVPSEDTQRERLSWHTGQLHQLNQVTSVATAIGKAMRLLQIAEVASPDWRNDADIEAILSASAGVDAALAAESAQAPLDGLRATVDADLALGGTGPADRRLLDAIESGDVAGYAAAWARLDELEITAARVAERTALGERLWEVAPRLAAAVSEELQAEWDTRLSRLEEAWAWGTTEAWIKTQESIDPNGVQAEIKEIEQTIRGHAENVAALRAWNHAVGPDRLTPGSRADLTQYAQLVRRLGKGTGKYATQQRAEIKQAMDRCRPAVPVWILPIYRIADQLRIEQNMFDVVLIDEASQAGLEATFLQYLAPKIVVIGDDKQVSPSAVGVDQEPLRRLADQYLYDDRYKASWQDPKRSLFDDARMRFGGQITLVEHRRCVPEIIGFSNRIAYEPDNIRLQPVRQFGADRLPPIKMVHVEDGAMEGSSGNRVNRAEARALVDRLKICLTDPTYDGRTFGVISLTGRKQAQLIESMLLSEVSPEDWAARDLRVGDAPDFQGSERHVMFLSMVAAWDPGARTPALTQEMYVQRYNVAVSRAQDQMWLFHTISLDQLPREDDMRHQLLAYCDEIVRQGPDAPGQISPAVPEDTRVEPFDSLFEQRVYNCIVERGFTVVPQMAAQGYLIDLVVVGGSARLAIECDGDAWHGPDAYQRDLARQRELERCGWTFCRIRESEFYVDTHKAMSKVWDALAELEIRPFEGDAGDDQEAPPVVTPASLATQDGLQQQLREEYEASTPPHQEDCPEDPVTSGAASVEAEDAGSVDEPVDEPIHASPPTAVDGASDELLDTEPADGPESRVLEAYTEFRGEVTPVAGASVEDILGGLLDIVDVEGPILGERLRSVYVVSSGGYRVGRATATLLNQALSQGIDRGILIASNPLKAAGFSETEFRLPGQARVRLRRLGTRTLDQIPPTELAEMIQKAAVQRPGASKAETYRQVLADLGRKVLTGPAEARFERVAAALIADDPELVGVLSTEVSWQGDQTGALVRPVVTQTDAVRAVLVAVQQHGRIARSDVMNVTGLEPARATALLAEMVESGQLERRGERRGAHYVLPGSDAAE